MNITNITSNPNGVQVAVLYLKIHKWDGSTEQTPHPILLLPNDRFVIPDYREGQFFLTEVVKVVESCMGMTPRICRSDPSYKLVEFVFSTEGAEISQYDRKRIWNALKDASSMHKQSTQTEAKEAVSS